MTQTYHIEGMTCGGCRAHVEESLSKQKGVLSVDVDLLEKKARIEVTQVLPIEVFENALNEFKGRYTIHEMGYVAPEQSEDDQKKELIQADSYYCPMMCEGDKTYPEFGDCPICGMDLVPSVTNKLEEEKTDFAIIRKFWIAVACTLPIFIIA
ncbi:heavy-metal-associated domain-containing protein, partial [Saprospiraceae bacterium]|nr:heavy-metal-associated domain-containing protein [Saprospiraceae bacterium]